MKLERSTRKDKKYMAIFSDGTVTHFGDSRYEDFTMHKDVGRRHKYIARHSRENWNDPKKAGTLSRYILWNKPTIRESLADFRRKFGV